MQCKQCTGPVEGRLETSESEIMMTVTSHESFPPGDSRPVDSNQAGPHPDLEALWSRRRGKAYEAPLHPHSRAALDAVRSRLKQEPTRILDAGCGTGASTARLAERHPDALVVGIDKSEHRLARAPELPDNALLIRADLVTAWRWLASEQLPFTKQYLLYPNPWPKSGHLARRWQGHPVLPILLGTSPETELRTNWRIYAEEFSQAAALMGCEVSGPVEIHPETILTPFESKYVHSGHVLYRVTVRAAEPGGLPAEPDAGA